MDRRLREGLVTAEATRADRVFHYRWEWDLVSSPESLWPLVAEIVGEVARPVDIRAELRHIVGDTDEANQ